MRIRPLAAIVALAAFAAAGLSAAENITVPNGSFESPLVTFTVNINIDSWQKSPQPAWYTDTNTYLWSQLIGEFKNTATNAPDHIDNCDGNQAIWMFARPDLALFQDYDTTDYRSTVPTHEFNAIYEPGKAYHLTVAVMGGVTNYGLEDGDTVELSLYYRDAASNAITVAATTVTNDSEHLFTNHTHLLDFHADTQPVKAVDAWAGQHIGIALRSTVTDTNLGGYWDLDNVRLTATLAPLLKDAAWRNGQFTFSVVSEPGLAFEIQAATNLNGAVWSTVGFITNTSGTVSCTNAGRTGASFFRARQLP
jgi:hypothetical protein